MKYIKYVDVTRAMFPDAPEPEPVNPEEKAPQAKPGAFQGRWRGSLSHFDGDVPLVLEIGADGTARAQFAKQPEVKLEKVNFAGGQFTGRMEGILRTQPGYHGVVGLEFRLRAENQFLRGIGVASAEGYFALSHWVSLQREPEP